MPGTKNRQVGTGIENIYARNWCRPSLYALAISFLLSSKLSEMSSSTEAAASRTSWKLSKLCDLGGRCVSKLMLEAVFKKPVESG
jgi:hypothetical protein